MVSMYVTTVDGRNPASVDMVDIPPLFARFYSSKLTVLHFLIHRSGSDGIHRRKRRKRRFDNKAAEEQRKAAEAKAKKDEANKAWAEKAAAKRKEKSAKAEKKLNQKAEKARAKAEAQRKEEAEKVFTKKKLFKNTRMEKIFSNWIIYFLALRDFMICFETSSGWVVTGGERQSGHP